MFGRACFAAGTPIRTPDGSTTIEQLKKGDLVLSRHEDDPDGPIEANAVEEIFVRESALLHLVAGGQTIVTVHGQKFVKAQILLRFDSEDLFGASLVAVRTLLSLA